MVQVLLRLHSHGTGCTFDWLKICTFTGDLFTRNQLDHKKNFQPVENSSSPLCMQPQNDPHMTRHQPKLYHLNFSYKMLKINILITESTVPTTLRYVGHFATMQEEWIVARAIKIGKTVGEILIFPRIESNKCMNRALKKSGGLGQLNFHARQVTL